MQDMSEIGFCHSDKGTKDGTRNWGKITEETGFRKKQ